jgi:hypothetical protein
MESKEDLSRVPTAPPASKATLQLLVLRMAGIAGAAIFGFFFVLTFSTPQWVERYAVDYIETRVGEKVDRKIDALLAEPGEGIAARVAKGLYEQNRVELDRLKQQFKAGVRETWAEALAEVRDLDCECREKWLDFLEVGTMAHFQSMESLGQRLTDFIQSSYMKVATDLKRDLRIFAATNCAMFLLLVLVSFLKPQAVRHLFVPGLLLCAATLFCAYLYVFEQNWLLTIIEGSYLGFAFAAYLGVAFLFLCDIVLNRCRVTTWLVNGLAELVGGVAALVPC